MSKFVAGVRFIGQPAAPESTMKTKQLIILAALAVGLILAWCCMLHSSHSSSDHGSKSSDAPQQSHSH